MLLKVPYPVLCRCCLLLALSLAIAPDLSAQSSSVDSGDNAAEFAEQAPAPSKPKFNIWQYEVKGVTLLEPVAVERALAEYLGKNLTLDSIETAANALESLYKDSGYPTVFVDIPEQNVVNGTVRLNVTEGVVGRLRVKDSDYFLLSDIKNRVPSIERGKALYIPDVQSELNALNALSTDLKVVPILKPGLKPGMVDVDLKVNDSLPLHGSIEFNDYASANTTESRLIAGISYDHLWQKYHSFSFQAQTSPEETDEVKVFSGTYVLPIKSNRLAFYFVDSDSEIATISGGDSSLLVLGDSRIFGARFIKPLKSSPDYQHYLTFGFDFKDVEEQVTFPEDPADLGITTPVTFGLWSTQYSATRRSEKSSTRFGVGAYFGLRGFGNNIDEFEDKRFRGEPNFFYLQSNFRRTDTLPADMLLVSRARLQATESSLISNEQYSAGGINTVRGYFESQRLGDQGIDGGVELHFPRFYKKSSKINDFRLLFFLEGGTLRILNPLPEQQNSFSLSSAGFGLKFDGFNGFTASLDWAYPFKDACDELCDEDSEIESGQSRSTFRLQYKF